MNVNKKYYATGKRKTSIARVWLYTGDGTIIINKNPLTTYFTKKLYQKNVEKPLEITGKKDVFNLYVNVKGGGISSQSEAIKQGISKVLLNFDPSLRLVLKNANLLTRDARIKERKKYGQPGARKRFQFSKR